MNRVQSAVAALPAYARRALISQKFAIAAGPTLNALHPALDNRACGFHAHALRRLFVAEYHQGEDGAMRPSRHPAHIVRHETGHFIDRFLLGGGHDYASEQNFLFRDSIPREIAAITPGQLTDAIKHHHAHVDDTHTLQTYYRRIFLNAASGAAEIFADLWARNDITADDCPSPRVLATLLPATAARIERLHNTLSKSIIP